MTSAMIVLVCQIIGPLCYTEQKEYFTMTSARMVFSMSGDKTALICQAIVIVEGDDINYDLFLLIKHIPLRPYYNWPDP